MAAGDTGGAKVKRGPKLKKSAKKKVTVTVPDAKDSTRSRRSTVPTPDQADRSRTPAQKTKDAAVVAKNVRESRVKALRKQNRGSGARAVKHAVQTVIHTNAPATVTTPAVTTKGGVKVHAVKIAKDLEPSKPRAQAPVIKVLGETTRPLHGVAAAAKANVHAIKTEGLKPRPFYLQASPKKTLKAATRGVENKDKTTTSDVLTEAGWNPRSTLGKLAKGAVSLTGDVVFDPTTYVTGGTGKVAVKVGEEAAVKATEKTAAARAADAATKAARPVTKKEAARAAERAKGGGASAPKLSERAKARAEKTGDQTKGIVIRVAGQEVPGVRKATAKASRPLRKAGGKVVPKRVREKARAIGADVNPNLPPAGVSREVSDEAINATRTARAKMNRGVHEAHQTAEGIRKVVGEANYRLIIDAIEHGTFKDLPVALRGTRDNPGPAVRLRSLFKHMRKEELRAGIPVGEIKHRAQVKLPEITADTKASAKELGKARRAEAAAERAVKSAEARHNVYQGRAEVGSRNVGGRSAETAAERGRNTKRARQINAAADRVRQRALKKGLTPMQADSAANTFRDSLKPPKYAAGGKGVEDTAAAIKTAEARHRDAIKAREAAEATHAQTIGDAAAQRAARRHAEQVNAKRAIAPKGYVPHHLTEEARQESGRGTHGVGRKVIRPSSAQARTETRPLSVIREEQPGKYSEDLANVYAARKAESATSTARGTLNRRIAELGRRVKKGDELPAPGQDKAVYHVKGSNIREVTSKHDLQELADTGFVNTREGRGGRYVILDREIVKRAVEGGRPTELSSGIVSSLDRVQGGFKRVALATPGFHVRNIAGDTQNAYLGQAGYRIPANMKDAGRVLKAEGRRDKSLRKFEQPGKGEAGFKTPKYGHVTYEQAAEQLSKHGAMRSGYTARELPELSKGRILNSRAMRKFKAAALNREDLPRLTTAIDALKHGATWEEAARKVADYHFDYAHLTKFEREVARRAAPFYTFTARNIPLQARSVVTKPGKYANYQKLREEASKIVHPDEQDPKTRALYQQLEAAGVKLKGGWEKYLSEYEQRNAGVPVTWKGQKFTVSLGLPLSDLSELPGAAGAGQAREYYQKGMSMTSPIPKDFIEYMENHSFFFRDQIEHDDSPLVNAPGFVSRFPDSVKKDLGIVKGRDKRGGQEVWKWPGKTDYLAHTLPGLPNLALKMLTPGTDRQNRGAGGKALQVAGIRAQPLDATSNAINLAYARIKEIDKRQATLRQTLNPKNGQPISATNPTLEYAKLSMQRKIAQRIAYQGKAQRGDSVLPAQGGPPRRRSSGVRLGGSSGGTVKLGGGTGGMVKLGG